MNAKWYASILFIILALLGLSQEQKKTSNQQVSLQFVDVALSSDTAHEEVLVLITQKLQFLGADAIEVVTNDTQQLSIRYYSAMDANLVEDFLTGTPITTDGEEFPVELPKENIPEKYRIVVSDLHMQLDSNLMLQATLVTSQDQKLYKLTYPTIANLIAAEHSIKRIDVRGLQAIYGDSFSVKKNTSYNIPEVRAGPIA
ncbi:hypothetical protein [Croceivirga sp. JEA036]|uniref:hypothetical protein n=1 Tax=Croceivirga sp. JEA036 TaxID=2721162 RepID=UPI0014391BAC|nr:hypothetical protein [Croceivirga sp. JEA036]NJB37356.1 hypothetical protein [Croceivirga sp. JEA036]